MFNQLLPQRLDNTYRGHKLALWLFALAVSMRTAQSLLVIFNGYSVAMSADGIPLDTYPPAAAQTVVALFALWGLSRLIIALLYVLVLVRYRSAIPLMFALQLMGFLGTRLIDHFIPMATAGTSPASGVNNVLLALTIIGLALSLTSRGDLQVQE